MGEHADDAVEYFGRNACSDAEPEMHDWADNEWITRDGTTMKWRDMTPAHLRNAARMLREAALDAYGKDLSAISFLHGEMAIYYAESEVDRDLESRCEMASAMEAYADEREVVTLDRNLMGAL